MGKTANGVRRIDTVYFDAALQSLNRAIETYSQAKQQVDQQTRKLKDTWTGKGAREFFDRSYWRLKQELDDSEETWVAMRDDLQAFYESYKTWDQQTAGSIAGKET